MNWVYCLPTMCLALMLREAGLRGSDRCQSVVAGVTMLEWSNLVQDGMSWTGRTWPCMVGGSTAVLGR